MTAFAFTLLLAVAGEPAAAGVLDPFDEAALGDALWQGCPDVVAARAAVAEAEANRERSYLLPNPGVTGTWGTIPLGERNPKDLAFSQVPNYSVSVSELVELGKRGPRQRAATMGREEARLALLDVYRARFFDLLDTLGVQASATARAAVLRRLVGGSEETLRLQRARADKGDVASLDVDRLEVEHLRLISSLGEADAAAVAATASCARILARACPRFTGEDDARRYLDRRVPAATGDEQAVAGRPDIQALRATEERAQAERVLAQRQKIPDPTVTGGYTHDQFVASGNQANSLMLSLSVPLPVFDRGQVDVARAEARARLAVAGQQAVSAAALRSAEASRRQLAELTDRAQRLDEKAIPLATSVATRMDAAARRGGAALQDVLLARRALEELQLDRVEVAALGYAALLDLRRAVAPPPLPPSGP